MAFKEKILNSIKPRSINVLIVSHSKGLIFLSRHRGDYSHLRKHKFKYSFLDTLNPTCIWGFHIQTLNSFILHYSLLNNESQIKNELASLAKFVRIPPGLTAAVSATGAAIPKKLMD